MDDTVQIKCRCKNAFRERARRLQNGYTRQCPSCEILLFFDEDSQDPNIKKAMRTARRVRKELREMEIAGLAAGVPSTTKSTTTSRSYSGRSRSDARAEDG
jgi:hypothetical protein